MTKRTTLLLLLAGVAAGGAIGYVAGSAGRVEAPLPGAATAAPPAGSPGARAPAPIPGRAPSGAAFPEVAVPPDLRGGGTIRGHVLTADGRPLAGVLVRAVPVRKYRALRISLDPPGDRDLEEVAREAVREELEERARRRDAVSAEDGTWALTGLADRSFHLSAWKRGYRVEPHRRNARPDAEVDLTAFPVVEVRIDLRLPDGSRPEDGQIEEKVGARRRYHHWYPSGPSITLDPGSVALTASGGVHRQYRSEERLLDLVAGQEPPEVGMALRPRPGIHGRIFDYDRYPGRKEVRWLPAPLETPPASSVLAKDGRPAPIRREGGEQTWFADTGDGRFLVGLVLDRNRVVDREVVTVAGGLRERDFTVPPPDPAASIVLRAEGPDGEPLRDVYATAICEPPEGGVLIGNGYLLPDGTVRVTHPVDGSGAPATSGRFWLDVSSKSCGRARFPYDGPTATSLTVRFGKPATLEIRLDGYAGTDYFGETKIELWRLDGEQREIVPCPGFRKLDPAGYLAYDPIVPGRFELVVKAGVPCALDVPVVRRTLTLGSGLTRETVRLSPRCSLVLIADGYAERTSFHLKPVPDVWTGWVGPGRSVEGGRVTFEGLPPGEYRVGCRGESMAVTVPAGGPVRFVPE